MKALILNSGVGSRMGALTSEHPKCMTEIKPGETILSRQLKQIEDAGISEVVMTTGYSEAVLMNYCNSLAPRLNIHFVSNPDYRTTNYIYSIYLARETLKDDDILFMHGDLVFENEVIDSLLDDERSVMAVSSTLPLPEKDFKAVTDNNGRILKVGVEFFTDAMAAQPFYKMKREDWELWLSRIEEYAKFPVIEGGQRSCYAEKALNDLDGRCNIFAHDVRNLLCSEIDTPEDLAVVSSRLQEIESRTVYLSFSAGVLHAGHIALIRKASRLGRLIVGVLSDAAIASYREAPLVSYDDRRAMFSSISGVWKVVEQNTLSGTENLRTLKPDIVVHGDNWKAGFMRPIRDETVSILAEYGGRLVEYPYAMNERYRELEAVTRSKLAMPDIRRGSLRKLIEAKGFVTALEAHDGLTGLIVENAQAFENGEPRQFDAMWVSSLCDSTAKGKPDIELVDMTSRFRTIEDITEVTTKPIIFDGDTGGRPEHFVYTVRTLERLGVSMVIIEDKTGLKKNSLFGTEVSQTQDSIESFSAKIRAGKKAQKTREFMICARIESLILERGLDDALERAFAFVMAGADAVMMHSRRKEPDEIFAFLERFREKDKSTPVVLVPTTYNTVKEEDFKARGANVIIYANHLMRSAVPAYQKTAETILKNHRSAECTGLMPFSEIIRLIPAPGENI